MAYSQGQELISEGKNAQINQKTRDKADQHGINAALIEIKNILADEKPHMFGLSGVNLKKDTDLSLVQHAEYTLQY